MSRPHLRDNDVCSIVLPGHSGSVIHSDLGWDTISDYLLNQIEYDGPFHLYGYSMGGRVALRLASDYPEKIVSLTLESTHPGLTSEGDRLDRVTHDNEVAKQLTSMPFTEFLEEWYSNPMWGDIKRWPRYQDMLMSRIHAHSPKNLAEVLLRLSLGKQEDFRKFLLDVSFPVQLISGGKDKKYRDIAIKLSALNNSIKCKVIPGTYHLPFLQLS